MKKILAFTLILAVAGLSASAQEKRVMKGDKQRMHQGHGQKADRIKALNLTDAQKQQLKADRENYKSKMEALRKDENITVKEMKARQKAIHDEQRAKMEALLTPEQKAKIAADRGSMATSGKKMHKKSAHMMKEQLSLTDDQATKLKAHNEATHDKIKAIKDNQSLSMEQKKAQMKAVKETSTAQRKTILTAEQMQKMEAFKKDRKGAKGAKGMKKVQTTR